MDEERLERARIEAREIMSRVRVDAAHTSSLLPDSVEELHNLPREEVVARYEVFAEEAQRLIGPYRDEAFRFLELSRDFLNELARRDAEAQGERMQALTRSLNTLTKWIVVLTAIIVVADVVPLAWELLSAAWSLLFG